VPGARWGKPGGRNWAAGGSGSRADRARVKAALGREGGSGLTAGARGSLGGAAEPKSVQPTKHFALWEMEVN
jgi:hypothetical protein